MKCIKPTDKALAKAKELGAANAPNVVRVSNDKARNAVNSGFYEYCDKKTWKDDGRHFTRVIDQHSQRV